jgi:hypothetical protein
MTWCPKCQVYGAGIGKCNACGSVLLGPCKADAADLARMRRERREQHERWEAEDAAADMSYDAPYMRAMKARKR